MSTSASRSRLATAALALGVLATLFGLLGLIWYAASGPFPLTPMFYAGAPTAAVAFAGVVVAIVALVRRARPSWMGAIGLVLSSILLTIAVAVVYTFVSL